MPFNFYDTHTLLMAVQQLTPAATFLRDRYFPTNDASDIFATDDVLVEFRDGSKKLAPFVAPRKGGVTVLRARLQYGTLHPALRGSSSRPDPRRAAQAWLRRGSLLSAHP